MDSAELERRLPLGGDDGLITSLVGRQVGPFQVTARLGGGAMASVYKAIDRRTGRALALKVLLPDADATVRERFRLEAAMVSGLDHPHIVHTLEVSHPAAGARGLDHSPEVTYIAMELVEGESVGDLLDRERTLTATDCCILLAPVARALAYAHGRGVVHRDVKPSNILLRRAEAGAPHSVRLVALDTPVVPLLSDFGIARALDAPDLTSVGRTIGTPAYMSPEQCAGNRELDGRSDIYSLGALFYRALVGRTLFVGTTTQILYSHVYDPVTVPDDVIRALSPLQIEILRRSLAKEPEDRFASAAEMADALQRASGRVQMAGAAVKPEVSSEHSTMTMPDLAVSPPTPSATHVLVAAPPLGVAAVGQPQTGLPAAQPAARAAYRPLAVPAPYPPLVVTAEELKSQAKAHPRALRWRGVLVGLLLAIPMFVLLGLATAALLNAGPWRSEPEAAAGADAAASATPLAMPAAVSGDVPSVEASAVPASTPVEDGAPASQEPPVPTETPEALPTPSGDIALYWEDAQQFFDDRDWASARSWLRLVQRIDPAYEAERVDGMLRAIALQVAAEQIVAGDYAAARDEYAAAMAAAPESEEAESLLRAAEALAGAQGSENEAARESLQVALASYGAALIQRSEFCDAEQQLQAALSLADNTQLRSYAQEVSDQCAVVLEAKADQKILESLTGRLLYSTQIGPDLYRIYWVAATQGDSSSLLVENARQPALAPGGVRLAFHDTRREGQGLSGFDLNAGLDAGDRSVIYTQGAGDAADSPPAWNLQGDRLVYAGVDPLDGRSRIFALPADNPGAPDQLANGQSPTWGWANDLIAFNGVGPSGAEPGIWLMQPDGQGLARLTDNGSDIRPAWTPDGAHVLFMSNGRSGSWDVFRVTLPGGEILQLTSEAAQDGIPAVSPDGRYVAYVSDRGGTWNIWVQPIDGGRALLLSPIEGTLTNWLEHNLQWIP